MEIRTIHWAVGDDLTVTPTKSQFAGVQGDHEVTRVTFSLPLDISRGAGNGAYIEFMSASGAYDKTDNLGIEGPSDDTSGDPATVTFLLPQAWTQEGGQATIRLVLLGFTDYPEDKPATAYTFEGKIHFEERQEAVSQVDRLIDGDIDRLMKQAKDAVSSSAAAVERADAAIQNADSAVETALNYAFEAARHAEDAKKHADAATEGASRVNISAVQTAEGADITVTDRDGAVTTVHLNNLVVVNGWADIQETVRLGIADTVFPVGYEFVTPDATTGANVIWAVRGHDHHQAVDNSLIHTMTLEAKHVYSDADGMGRNFVFGAAQALYYAETELAAGTYHFGWQYANGAIKSGSYQFTLTQPVPAGGQIVLGTFSSSIEITNCMIATFGSVGAMDPIESDIMVTSGSEGVNLGTVYNNYSTNKNLNCAQRILWGSSNYAQSAVRQWLNSDQAAGAVWVPTTRFDRPPTWADTYAGFMSGLPAEFLAVVQTAAIPCRTNAVFEVDDLYGTEFAPNEVHTLHDKFFLLSRPEVYGTWYSTNYKDGEPLEFYEGFTDTECIKYDAAGLVRVAWLRSPFPSHTHNERLVNAKGTLAHDGAFHELAVAPACIIA